MENIKLYLFIIFAAYVFSFVPQPHASIFLALLMIAGVRISYRDDKQHAHEKNELKRKAEEAKNKNNSPWHEVLGSDENASLAEATKLRRLLSKIYHPDNGEMPNKEAMQRINQAYEEKQNLEKEEQHLLN